MLDPFDPLWKVVLKALAAGVVYWAASFAVAWGLLSLLGLTR